jgi:hypothetical protein
MLIGSRKSLSLSLIPQYIYCHNLTVPPAHDASAVHVVTAYSNTPSVAVVLSPTLCSVLCARIKVRQAQWGKRTDSWCSTAPGPACHCPLQCACSPSPPLCQQWSNAVETVHQVPGMHVMHIHLPVMGCTGTWCTLSIKASTNKING